MGSSYATGKTSLGAATSELSARVHVVTLAATNWEDWVLSVGVSCAEELVWAKAGPAETPITTIHTLVLRRFVIDII